MTNEQQFFLQVLADHLNQRKTNPPEGLDWQQLYSYAKSHQIQAIIGYQCKNYLAKKEEYREIKKELVKDIIKCMYFYVNNSNAYAEIKDVFENRSIQYFPVKGLAIAGLFPIPAYRTMGDIDIVVHEEDKELIQEEMIHKGYKVTKNDYELIMNKNTVTIEIHDHLVYKQNQESANIANYFNDCWSHIHKNKDGEMMPDWHFHFMFLIQHTKKHFHGNGIGFRQFMDIALTAQVISKTDWIAIERDLRMIGLWDFTLIALTFCNRWFGIDFPIKLEPIDEKFYEESTVFVFKNGVFGFDNEHHKEHALERRLRASKMPKIISKMKIIFRDIFIPYEEMKLLPYCKFIQEKRYLLPFAWIYRTFYILRNKKHQFTSERSLVFKSEDIMKRHQELMKRWGL